MMRTLAAVTFASSVLIFPGASFATAQGLIIAASTRIAMFDQEAVAKKHCVADRVVWVNARSGLYHEKGMPWYGRTDKGAYVCRKEAIAAGYRVWRSGE